jgi:hypothetical protein
LTETPQDRDEVADLGDTLGAPVHQVVALLDGPIVSRQSTVAQAAAYRTKFSLPDHVLSTAQDTSFEAVQFWYAATAEGEFAGFPTTLFLTPEGTIFRIRAGSGEEGDTTQTLQNAPAAPAPTMLTPPRILGTPLRGRPLDSTTGQWEGADSILTQWSRCNSDGTGCQPITGATSRKYSPVRADLGHRLQVSATASRRGTAATATASVDKPAITGLKILGNAKVGRTLQARPSIKGLGQTSYLWKRGRAVVGRSATHRIVAADQGRRLTLIVVTSNALGSDRATTTSKRVRR